MRKFMQYTIIILPYLVIGFMLYSNISKGDTNDNIDADSIMVAQNAEADTVIAEKASPVVENKDTKKSDAYFAVISKQDMMIRLYDTHAKLIFESPMACGIGLGNKTKEGDMKTPEGVFKVQQVQDASGWSHDFKDGKGDIKGAYGPYFIRLATPGHKGIGIHGTHAPESIGTRASEGCIRMNNDELKKFRSYVYINMPIIITTSTKDVMGSAGKNDTTKQPAPIEQKTSVAPSPAKETSASKPNPSSSSKPAVMHKVKSGQTLSSIAREYNTTVQKIKELNPGMKDNISAGKQIRVK